MQQEFSIPKLNECVNMTDLEALSTIYRTTLQNLLIHPS